MQKELKNPSPSLIQMTPRETGETAGGWGGGVRLNNSLCTHRSDGYANNNRIRAEAEKVAKKRKPENSRKWEKNHLHVTGTGTVRGGILLNGWHV